MNISTIEKQLDWKRIQRMMLLGLLAAIPVFIADMLLGYGVMDENLTGMERYLSAYVNLPDWKLFWSALLGLIGIPIEGVCYFSIYRLMADRAPQYARIYRVGIIGYIAFGACGVHVPCLVACYVYKTMYAIDSSNALNFMIHYGLYFMVPAVLLFILSWFVLVVVQILAFLKKKTPYPKWCCIFSLLFIVFVAICTSPFESYPLANGLSASWISIANLWMFGGLLLMSKRIGEMGKE